MSGVRYLALAGAPDAIRGLLGAIVPGSAKPQRLNRLLDLPGLVLFAAPETPCIELAGSQGIILGRLFEKGTCGRAIASLGERESYALSEGQGEQLLERYWGNYVAFLGHGPNLTAVRDPSAAVPAYHSRAGGLHLYCSHLDLANELVPMPEIDWQFLVEWLAFPFLRGERTGLIGWKEISPGTAHSPAGGAVTLWTPRRAISRTQPAQDFNEAAQRIRECAVSTIGRLLEGRQSLVLELSGGLDSSIVGACLRENGIKFEAMNFVTRLPDGDERHYAQLVAGHFGVELNELKEDRLAVDLYAKVPPSFRPPLSPVLQPLGRARLAFAGMRDGLEFVTGAGGDNIFCYLGTAAPILDAVRQRGLGQAVETLGDVAMVGDCTIFKAARFAFMKALGRPFRPVWKRDERFLSADARAQGTAFHPWLEDRKRLCSGRLEHVESLVRALHFLEPHYDNGICVIHPLLNQPLIEECLAIPSWMWVKSGRNRAVARAAFSELLPGEIINRRTKGRLESMCSRAFADKRSELESFLLDGEVARLGLIDRQELAAYLRLGERFRGDDYFRVFDLASMEMWLRSLG